MPSAKRFVYILKNEAEPRRCYTELAIDLRVRYWLRDRWFETRTAVKQDEGARFSHREADEDRR